MRIIGIIPERMRSSRFPGKPIEKINDKPMVQYVYENSLKSKLLEDVYVATGDKEIIDCVHGFNGRIIKTRDDHYRATNQCAEALRNLEDNTDTHYDLICLIQGDEPMVNHEMIRQSLQPLIKDKTVNVTNLMGILDEDDPNEVKVVTDHNNNALYFSRGPIPLHWKNNGGIMYKQVCIMGFRHDMLLYYPVCDEGCLEKAESVDMLRYLENGIDVHMVLTRFETYSVDTKKDLKFVEALLK